MPLRLPAAVPALSVCIFTSKLHTETAGNAAAGTQWKYDAAAHNNLTSSSSCTCNSINRIGVTVPTAEILDHCKPLVEERSDGILSVVHITLKG